MIKINLLPQEEAPAPRSFRLPKVSSVVPLVAVLAVLAGVGLAYTYQARRVVALKATIAGEEAESRRLAPEIAKIQSLNKERDEVNRRLDVITQLDRDRYFRVHLLDEINRALPEHMWLTRVEETSANKIAIEGVTFSNFLVSDLLQNLTRSPFVGSVDLVVAEKGLIEKVPVVKFKATATSARAATDAVSETGTPAADALPDPAGAAAAPATTANTSPAGSGS
jgi:type IV pilus assembly protein PilN